MPETWKDIPGFPGYEASDQGRIRSHKRSCVRYLRPACKKDGHLVVVLSKEGKCHTLSLHRLILEAWIGPRPQGHVCDHINTVRGDNRLANLRWVTPRENNLNPITRRKRSFVGRAVCCLETGERFPNMKIAAAKMGVCRCNINLVCQGKRSATHGLHFSYAEEVKYA